MSNLRKIRTIKELLEIDIEFLYENSMFKMDSIDDPNDTRNFLLFNLKTKFLGIFDQFQISIFDGKALHIEFRSKNYRNEDFEKLLETIVDEYGKDGNNQNATDGNKLKHISWWFKNTEHEQTYDEPNNSEDLYYGIMVGGMNDKRIELSLIDYSNIDSNLNSKNWLQQR